MVSLLLTGGDADKADDDPVAGRPVDGLVGAEAPPERATVVLVLGVDLAAGGPGSLPSSRARPSLR